MPIKRYNGSSQSVVTAKRWNGSAWVKQMVKKWNGSAWITVSATPEPPPPPPTYTWKKYVLISELIIDSYAQTSSNGGTEKYSIGATVYSSYGWDSSSGTYSSAGSITGIVSGGYDGFGSTMTGYQFLYYDTDSSYAWFAITDYGAEIDSSHYEYSKGTYIEDVTSENASAYPTDGYINGYWYVKQ